MAAELGFEPRHTESESAVLPLHNSAIACLQAVYIVTQMQKFVNTFFEKSLHKRIKYISIDKVQLFEKNLDLLLTNENQYAIMIRLLIRLVGQAVKTSASHAENMGSIPVRVTKAKGHSL